MSFVETSPRYSENKTSNSSFQSNSSLQSNSLPMLIPTPTGTFTQSNSSIPNKNQTLLYSLTHSRFDPTDFSPPNNFISKLRKRMNVYDEFIAATSPAQVSSFELAINEARRDNA